MIDTEALKAQAADRAVEFIRSGMVVGLGHGSTTAYAIERLAELLSRGVLKDIQSIACSRAVEAHAARLSIPQTTLEVHATIDLTIDGADEVDPRMDLIKGGGGALLREKVVASASRREIIIVDSSKLSDRLGTRFALPVEVIPFAWTVEHRFLQRLGAETHLRAHESEPFRTDQGNYILDCRFPPIDDAYSLSRELDARPGIVAHGLFLGMATDLIVSSPTGLRHQTR